MKLQFVTLAALLAGASLIGCTHNGGGSHAPIVISQDSSGIVVAGRGVIEAPPDIARLTVGVEYSAKTVAEAREGAAKSAKAIIASLEKNGVDGKDVQTGQLTIAPRYEYPPDRQPQLNGYTVTNNLTVTIRKLDAVSRIVDDAVIAGGDATRLQGIVFELDKPDALRSQARAKAMEEARAKAQQLAKLSGVDLGTPISVEESVSDMNVPYPLPMMEEAKGMDRTATPIEPGMGKVSVDVRVRWAIGG
jgi:uncharacterized protein YggE